MTTYSSADRIRGFTLLELLVVVSIIGLLSAVVLTTMNTARAKSRDATRMQTVKQLQRAIELYYDANGRYPARNTARSGSTVASEVCTDGTRGSGGASGAWCLFMADIAPYYSGGLRDPNGDAQIVTRYYYDANSSNNYTTYGLMTVLEYAGNSKITDTDGGIYCSSSGTCARPGTLGFEMGTQPATCQAAGQSNWWATGAPECP